MKYLFSIIDDKSSLDKYIIRHISEEEQKAVDDIIEKENKFLKRKTIPSWLTNTSFFGIIVGIYIVAAVFINEEGFKETYEKMKFLFYIAIALIAIGVIIITIAIIKNKKLRDDPEFEKLTIEQNAIANQSIDSLNVPADYIEMDLLLALVKYKNGEEVIVKQALSFLNASTYAFVENELLCFADSVNVYAIPLNSITKIYEVDKTITLPSWNKNEPINSEKYKKYKLVPNNGGISSRPHYKVFLTIDNEKYYFCLANYDIDNFKKLINYNESIEK